MKQNNSNISERILGASLLFYTLPVLVLTLYSMNIASEDRSWGTLCLGLLLAAVGTAALYLVARKQETSQQPLEDLDTYSTPAPQEHQEAAAPQQEPAVDEKQIHELNAALVELQDKNLKLTEQEHAKNEEIARLQQENELFQQKSGNALQDLRSLTTTLQEQLKQKEALLEEHQQTITEQRGVIEGKQEQIAGLKEKIHDLTYEMKTLLDVVDTDGTAPIPTPTPSSSLGMAVHETAQLYQTATDEPIEDDNEALPESMVHTSEEAAIQLRRCLNIAQKITGAGHAPHSPFPMHDMPANNYTLDLRRLFDSLRSENASPVLVYSQKENKLLFINNQSKSLLGWNPEKFVQHFNEIVHEGLNDWKNAINQLAASPESHASLVMKTKSGQDLLVHCQLATVPSGLFRNHVLGVLYPAA